MKSIKLFQDKSGKEITNLDILKTFETLKAFDCEVLYLHSSLSFGLPNPELRRTEILECLFNILLELKVPTICMPTYTFSFCNGKSFDPASSKSRMGALNEYFRVQNGVIRSDDPLMSIALLGKDKELVTHTGSESIGKNSSFDLIRNRKNVKFIFLGTGIGDCFTYMHYLEWMYKVDYRYNRPFKGIVVDHGKQIEKEYILFVRYRGVFPNDGSYIYEDQMYKDKIAKKIFLGDSSISVVDEVAAAQSYKDCLDSNPYFFVKIDPAFEKYDDTFVLDNEMVAL